MTTTSTALGRLFDRARQEVDDRLPGCQLAVAKDGELLGFETFGAGLSNDNRFLMWSCTKAITAAVIWQLVGEGKLEYGRTVASYLPGFESNGKDAVTVEHLLLHTAGFPRAPLGPRSWATSAQRREAFGRWHLDWDPGTRFEYHALSAGWVLAELIVEVTGRDYRDEVTSRVCEPLGLSTLRLGVPDDQQADIADLVEVGRPATEAEFAAAGLPWSAPPDLPSGAMLFLNAPAARSAGIPSGGAVATAADVARFYQGLLHNPDGLWNDEVLNDATGTVRNTFPDGPKGSLPANRTRGVVVRGSHPGAERMMHFGPGTSPRTFGHDGAGGQIAWADPQSGLSFCFLTNGMDADGVREAQRCQDLARLAAACAD